jgi:hypothetical protein
MITSVQMGSYVLGSFDYEFNNDVPLIADVNLELLGRNGRIGAIGALLRGELVSDEYADAMGVHSVIDVPDLYIDWELLGRNGGISELGALLRSELDEYAGAMGVHSAV